MFPAGSKLFLGLTGASAAGFLVYGFLQEWGTLGVVGLATAAVVFAFLAGISIAAREGTVSAGDSASVAAAPAAQPTPANSMWPVVAAVGGVLLVIGLVTDRRWFVGGLVVMFVALVEWTIQNWADRASSDSRYNARARGQLLHALEMPLFAAVGLGAIIFAFSRIMLNADINVSLVIFVALATLITVFGFVFAGLKNVKRGTVAGVCVAGAVALLAGGIWAAADGEKPKLAKEAEHFNEERALCGEEITEADEDASGAVAMKSSTAVIVTLKGDQLVAAEGGRPVSSVFLQRGNTANILFKNESGTEEERRLNAEFLVNALDSNGKPTSDLQKKTVCTNAIKSGKVQLLTLNIPKSSDVDTTGESFKLVVPGVETAVLELEVH